MSKKATRRAAREAFPKAKNPAPKKSTYSKYSRSAKPAGARAAAAKARSARPVPRALRKPTLRGSIIYAVVVAAIFLLAVSFIGHTKPNIWGYVVLGVGAIVVYTPLTYVMNMYTYKKRLERMAKDRQGGGSQNAGSTKVQKSKSK